MSVLSTGIGLGNIDISVTELDALVNVDFESRTVRPKPRQLTLLRLGTSGGLQTDIKVGDFVFARTSIGFDGVLSFYGGNDGVRAQDLEREFIAHMGWRDDLTRPYAVDADSQLRELFSDSTIEGITIASPGFYAPQGRHVRVGLADESINERMEQFSVGGRRVTNYEMESSLLAGLAKLMGHRAATICTIIAQRVKEDACTDYKPFVRGMIEMALDKLATL